MRKRIKNLILLIMLFTHMLCSFSYAKTIDINGINVSLDVETKKKQVGIGVDVNDNNKYSDTEYEKEEKEIEDEYVDICLNIKNKNSYENAKVVVEESIPNGFRKVNIDTKNSRHNLSLEPNATKEYKYTYKYHKSYLKDQNNEFLYDSDGNIIDDKNNIKYIENNKKTISNKNGKSIKYSEKDSNDADEIVRNANKKHGYKIIISIILFFVCVGGIFLFKILYGHIKDNDDETFGNDYNGFIFIIVLLMFISTLFTNKNIYAKEYKPQIQEFGKTYTKVISERVKYNDVYYVFAYKVTVEYENTYEVTDEDYEVDTDGDGLVDAFEYEYMTDKNNPDTDSDGISDYEEVMLLDYNPLSIDTFEDGVYDGNRDYDLDGLTNKEEIEYGTNLTLVDTDYDTISDYDEINKYFTNPLSIDTDEDLLSDPDELKLGLDPNNPKTDGVTLDSERKINQNYNMENVPMELKEGNIIFKNIYGDVTGNIDKIIKVTNYNNENLNNSKGIVGNSFKVESDNDSIITIVLDASKVSDRTKFLTICKYEDGILKPIRTYCNNDDEIFCDITSGKYCIADSDLILRELNIYNNDYKP